VFNKEKNLTELNVNLEIGLDDTTRPVSALPDPMIETCFLDNNQIFINVFHTKSLCMYHMTYNFLQGKLIGDAVQTQLAYCTINFPIKSFYDEEKDQVYMFYRQG